MKESVWNLVARALRWLVIGALAWLTLGALLFSMWWSSILGALATLLFAGWELLPKLPRRAIAAVFPALAIVAFLQISAPEYMERSTQISCEVHYLWSDKPAQCDGVEFDRHSSTDSGHILSLPEQMGIRWVNATMAAGGVLVGFEDVAYETLLLQFGSNPEIREDRRETPLYERKPLCHQAKATPARTVEASGTIALESSRARHVVKDLADSLQDGQAATTRLRWRNYASPDQTWATTLALWVPQSEMKVSKTGPNTLETTWSGVITYPRQGRIFVTLPRPYGPSYRFGLDEALFCAAQLDGVFVPYRMNWNHTLAADHPWLDGEVDQNSPGLVEQILRPRANDLGMRHSPRIRSSAVRQDQ